MHVYNTVAPSGGSPRWAQSPCGPNDADKEAMKVEGQARPPETLAMRLWTCARALPVAGCTLFEGMDSQRIPGMEAVTGPTLASPRACCFVTSRLRCTHRRHSCFLLVAMPLHCPILPLHPWRSNGNSALATAPFAVANAKALQLPLPPKPGWPVSLVIWFLRQAVGHLRQPWDPRLLARQEPPVGARCPVTPVNGMISGYDYDYACMYVRMYVLAYVCMYVCMYVWPC